MRWRVAPRAGRTHNAYTTCTRTDWEHVFGRVSNLCVGLDIFCGPVGSGRVRFCLSGPQACNIYHILRSTHLWFSCQGARRDDFDYILRLALRPPPPPPRVEKSLCMRSTRGRFEGQTDNKERCIQGTVCSQGSAQSTEPAASPHMNGRWMAAGSLSRSSQAFEACGANEGTEPYANCLQQAAWRAPHDGSDAPSVSW